MPTNCKPPIPQPPAFLVGQRHSPNDYLQTIACAAAFLANGQGGSTPEDTGLLQFRNLSGNATPQSVKAGSGNIYALNLINPNTTPVYVKFYNVAAGSVVVGTTPVALTVAVPAGDSITPGIVFGSISPFFFSTAISFAVVTGLADSNAGAPASNIHVGVTYR